MSEYCRGRHFLSNTKKFSSCSCYGLSLVPRQCLNTAEAGTFCPTPRSPIPCSYHRRSLVPRHGDTIGVSITAGTGTFCPTPRRPIPCSHHRRNLVPRHGDTIGVSITARAGTFRPTSRSPVRSSSFLYLTYVHSLVILGKS